MKLKNLLAVLLSLALFAGMIPAMTFGVSAAPTLTNSYEARKYIVGTIDAEADFRSEGHTVIYKYGFDAKTECPVDSNDKIGSTTKGDWYQTNIYTGANYTCTNQWGVEVAVNEFGFVTAKGTAGNMAIPENGFVISAVNGSTSIPGPNVDAGNELKNNVEVGDYIRVSGSNYYVYKTTDDSKFTDATAAFNVKKTQVLKITEGGDGVTTGTNEWNNDVLVKATGTGADGVANHAGYVVRFGGNNIEVPSGYFAVSLSGQTMHDTAVKAYNGAQLFEEFAAPGAIVNIGSAEIYFRYDVAAAKRAARLMSGTTDSTVTTTYDYSAATIYNDAVDKYELVDTARLGELYSNMEAIADAVQSMTTIEAMEPYMATLYQNYNEMRMLEYEKRPVEMRAVWIRPLPNDRKERTVAELDQLLEDAILEHKALGYNQIFIEAFYNSCTTFPVPSTAGYNGLYYSQNPYLVPTTMTCGSSGQPGLNPNLSEPYDMLQRFIEICRENEVEPHIWWEVFYVGYTRTDPSVTDALFEYSVAQQILNNTTKYKNYLNTAHTGSLYYGAETDGAHQYFLNPGSTGVRTFLMNTFEYILETYDAESFQLDYIRYPHTSAEKCFGYDSDTLAAFHAAYPNNSTDLYTYNGFYDADWVQFRANYVTSFIEDLRALIAEVNPGYYLSSSPGADPEDSKKNLMQDVEYWLENDLIDILYPMAYGQNVPGMVAPGLVANNADHFVCIGTSAGYDDDAYEQRWLKEVRDAGADGIAAFGTIDSWVNYAWETPAITPTGNATKAASTWLNEVLVVRAAKMLELGDISQSVYSNIAAKAEDAAFTIRVNGIESTAALTALNALQTVANTLPANAKTAMTGDINYILKIRSNSHDTARQAREEAQEEHTFETIDGATYISGSDTLYVTANGTKLSGAITQMVTVLTAEAVAKMELDNLSFTSGSGVAFEVLGDALQLELTGDNHITANTFATLDVTYCGTGALYSDGALQFQMGDVSDDGLLNSTDIRDLLRVNVKYTTLSASQKAISDANGDGKINTIDTRIFLDAYIG
ncbi:MAG: family 10 glycosylhydrolase [Clostridia bacterium]|nr:family 10 glycosylhydrolase [Clostridia bacterium]